MRGDDRRLDVRTKDKKDTRGRKKREKKKELGVEKREDPRRSLGYHNMDTCYLLPPTFLFFFSLSTLLFSFSYFFFMGQTSPDSRSRYVCNSEDG